jgi:sterol desaturase/sphingolipid hydroxylase (fatty acid hydroxylase superfamily)
MVMAAPLLCVVYEGLCWFSIVGITMVYELYGALGLAAFTLFQLLVVYGDFHITPTASGNMRRAQAHGFKLPVVVAIMLVNLVGTNALVAWIVSTFCGPMYEEDLQIDLGVLIIVLVNLALSEVCFTTAHTALHRTDRGARLHHLHHCCKPCSWSSNLIIHPLDMAIEFSGPVLVLLFTHHYIFHHPTAFFLSITVLQLWYAIDHSEVLQLTHYKHHTHVNTFYCIYLKWRTGKPGADRVKALMATVENQ